MINAITPNVCYQTRSVRYNPTANIYYQSRTPQANQAPNFKAVNKSVLFEQKLFHSCEFCFRKMLNRLSLIPARNRKTIELANEVFSAVKRNSPEYICAISIAGRGLAEGREVNINTENGIIERLAKSGRPHIFIMNHDNQMADPSMLSFFNTMLNEEYINSDIAETCPRPRIILNEDILLSMHPKQRNVYESLGAIGVDVTPFNGNKVANGRKMAQIMKEYVNQESNIFIFPEGINSMYKHKTLREKFQPGIANIIAKLISKTDVSVVPVGFAYKKFNSNLGAIQIGEPVVFEKNTEISKEKIFDTICSALENEVNTAKAQVPQKALETVTENDLV